MAKKVFGHVHSKEQGIVVTQESAPRRSMTGLSPHSTATIKEGPMKRLMERLIP